MNSETYTPPAHEPKPTSILERIVQVVFCLVVLLILAAIIIPTTSHSRESAPRSVDSSNLRQIGQASLIYASDSKDQLPQVDDIHAFARDLARIGGLNDATIWIASSEAENAAKLSTVLAADRQTLEPSFASVRPSFAAAVRGLNVSLPSTTPVAWTRGLRPDGTWSKDSPYGGEGGHIVFLGGNVSFYRNTKGALIDRDGKPATDIRAALPADAVIANN